MKNKDLISSLNRLRSSVVDLAKAKKNKSEESDDAAKWLKAKEEEIKTRTEDSKQLASKMEEDKALREKNQRDQRIKDAPNLGYSQWELHHLHNKPGKAPEFDGLSPAFIEGLKAEMPAHERQSKSARLQNIDAVSHPKVVANQAVIDRTKDAFAEHDAERARFLDTLKDVHPMKRQLLVDKHMKEWRKANPDAAKKMLEAHSNLDIHHAVADSRLARAGMARQKDVLDISSAPSSDDILEDRMYALTNSNEFKGAKPEQQEKMRQDLISSHNIQQSRAEEEGNAVDHIKDRYSAAQALGVSGADEDTPPDVSTVHTDNLSAEQKNKLAGLAAKEKARLSRVGSASSSLSVDKPKETKEEKLPHVNAVRALADPVINQHITRMQDKGTIPSNADTSAIADHAFNYVVGRVPKYQSDINPNFNAFIHSSVISGIKGGLAEYNKAHGITSQAKQSKKETIERSGPVRTFSPEEISAANETLRQKQTMVPEAAEQSPVKNALQLAKEHPNPDIHARMTAIDSAKKGK